MNLATSEWQQIQGDARSLITDIEDIPLSESPSILHDHLLIQFCLWPKVIVFAVIFYELGQIHYFVS